MIRQQGHSQKGYSQIEVLISVLVLAIGILGMGGLQAKSLQNSQRSVLRTQAAYLSYEILDRMRANLTAAKANAYNTGFNDKPTGQGACLIAATGCAAADLATYDVQEWKCSVGGGDSCNGLTGLVAKDTALPKGEASIAYADSLFTISIRWDETRSNTEAEPQTYTIVTAL